MNVDLTQFGGRKLMFGNGSEQWSFGWCPVEYRSSDEKELHDSIVYSMPKFQISGVDTNDTDKACMWQFSKAVNNGQHFMVFRQVTGSCFPPGTPIRMADGSEKSIEKVALDDKVISHTGKERNVVSLFQKDYTGDMYTFHLKGHKFPITATHDHMMMVVERKKRAKWRWKPGKVVRKPACEVQPDDRMILSYGIRTNDKITLDMADYVECEKNEVKVRNKKYKANRFIDVDTDFAWLMGLFLAEGSNKDSKRFEAVSGIRFSLNIKETEFANRAEKIIKDKFGDVACRHIEEPQHNCRKLEVTNQLVGGFFKALSPDKVWTKRVPSLFFRCDEPTKLALLRGWMDGDGHFQIRKIGKKNYGFCLRGVSASHGLIKDMMCIAHSCGMGTKVGLRKRAPHQRVAAMDLYITGLDALRIYPEKAEEVAAVGIKPQVYKDNRTKEGFVTKIDKITTETVKDYPVYCCEVEEDHSLLVQGISCFNCVGNGGGQAVWYLSAADVALRGDPEVATLPFYLLPYGRSRYYSGMRGRGEGSTGSGFAEAIRKDGVLPFNASGLPQPDMSDGISWGQSAEMAWSDGGAISDDWLSKSRKYIVQTTAPVNNANDVKNALRNGYPCTIASDWGGMMSPQVTSNPGVLLNKRVTTWNHQMSVQGWWAHPELGDIFYILNSWGPKTHGQDPAGGPPGGFWVLAKDIDYITGQGDSFAFSQWQGFPAQRLDWYF